MNTLLIYLVCAALLLSFSFLIFRVSFRRDFHQQGRLSPLSLITGSLVFFCWGGFPYIYGISDWPIVHTSQIALWIGRFFLFGGLAVMFVSMTRLGILRSFGCQQNTLIQRGFYKYSRNPQVAGVVLYGIGFAILWPSWYALGWFLLLLPIVHMMVMSEEEHLHNAFGEAYDDYCQRVPRYIGIPKVH
ncbi:MAG: methyltransferase [Chloroflexota bacterium]|nr:methyltransferase [Chloroflexota bacterium]